MLGHGREAATRTKEAVRAVVEMLVAWVALFVPALRDLCLVGVLMDFSVFGKSKSKCGSLRNVMGGGKAFPYAALLIFFQVGLS